MRPRRQEGQVKLHGAQWVLAFYKDVLEKDGTTKRKRVESRAEAGLKKLGEIVRKKYGIKA